MIVSTLDLEDKFKVQLKDEFPGMPVIHTQLSSLSIEQLAEVEIMMTYGYDMTTEMVQKMSRLKWLHIGQSGMDPLPFDLLKKKGVYLTNSRGINSGIISEYVLCAMLNIARKTFQYEEKARQKIWASDIEVEELSLKTVGIFGLGMVGKEIAKRCKAFGMRVLGVDVLSEGVPFVDQIYLPYQRQAVLAQCDFAVLSMPLLPSTKGMFDRSEFSALPNNAWVINVGRGPLIVNEALVEAIDSGKIAGAVLDVFSTEPLPADDVLWTRKNIWITPHHAGDHFPQYAPRMVEIIRYNMARYPDFKLMRNPILY